MHCEGHPAASVSFFLCLPRLARVETGYVLLGTRFLLEAGSEAWHTVITAGRDKGGATDLGDRVPGRYLIDFFPPPFSVKNQEHVSVGCWRQFGIVLVA